LATIHASFKCAGLNVKWVQKLTSECNPLIHAAFNLANYLPVICLDEVLKDDRTYAHLWGGAPVGEHVKQHNPFVHKQCLLMLAAMALDQGIMAARVVEGSFTHQIIL
ncbi:hypothetical protein F4604DRAFT_1568152, partial [Suillus subluteus]